MLGTPDNPNSSPFDSRPLRHRSLEQLLALQEQLMVQADRADAEEREIRLKWVEASAKVSRLSRDLGELAWEIHDARQL